MKLAVLITALVYFAVMTWAVHFHFASARSPLPFVLLSIVSVANLAVFGHFVWRQPQGIEWLGASLALQVAALLLFMGARHASRTADLKLLFDPSEPHGLVQSGPYRYIRHPFYASYLLYWSGCALATLHPFNIAYAAMLVPLLALGALTEERKFARSPLRNAYADYRRRAGLFWPRLLKART
ncbi:MAG: isoprenylcysteine carboxylmethyltransferase family protein [Hyphomicrobiaceae bacterium]|nr:isoprenylcysteine carboxylmethyltransferase family protein [Hyphomicrobiaceae bacterium]